MGLNTPKMNLTAKHDLQAIPKNDNIFPQMENAMSNVIDMVAFCKRKVDAYNAQITQDLDRAAGCQKENKMKFANQFLRLANNNLKNREKYIAFLRQLAKKSTTQFTFHYSAPKNYPFQIGGA